MKVIQTPRAMARLPKVSESKRVLVPTMGALHAGHGSLIKTARHRAGQQGQVVVSIFVNPTQFGPGEDFERYPRPWKKDRDYCEELGVDIIFRPRVADLYHRDHSVRVVEDQLSSGLCGASRPGHFAGVLTIVTKLFHLVHPDEAIFGDKDYQQLTLIRRLVRDLDFPIKIIAGKTARERDGLAMSSRNVYLEPEQRAAAAGIYQALQEVKRKAATQSQAAPLRRWLERRLASLPGAKVDYVALVDGDTLAPLKKLRKPAVAAVAVWFGETRLLDHLDLR